MKPVYFANPHAAFAERRRKILDAVTRVLDSGTYIMGNEVSAFEQRFAKFSNSAYCSGVASGTDALEVALRAFGIGRGHAVYTVSHTAVATVAAIERAGAVPVFIDIKPDTCCMDPDSLEKAIARTQGDLSPAAVIPVHIYGKICEMESILKIARKNDLRVIEDCAQAHGAFRHGTGAGCFGDAACFSFYPTKNLGGFGDGGAIATNDAAFDARCKSIRQYGWEERYISSVKGVNSRLDPIQAAMLSVQLDFLEEDIARRRAIATLYIEGLRGVDLVLPLSETGCEDSYHLFVIQSAVRDELAEHLRSSGVFPAIHYPLPVHMQPAYEKESASLAVPLPVTERVCGEILTLPMYPQLTDTEIAGVIAGVRGFYEKGARSGLC